MRVVIANAGTHPEPMHLAIGFAERDHLVEYWTSSSWSRDSLFARIARGRVSGRGAVGRTMRRRILPDGLDHGSVHHAAVAAELRFQVAMRRSLEERETALRAWLAQYEGAVARRVARTAPDVVFSQYMWAREIFRSAPSGTLRVLGYPTAHHRWIDRTFSEEARANPAWAPFLQGNDQPIEVLERFDDEIELADLVLVPSTFAAATFSESGVPQEKVRVAQLAPAIDAGTVAADVGAEHLWAGDSSSFKVLWVGQVTQRKGLSYLLEAIDAVPEARLQIVGDVMPGIQDLIARHERVHVRGSQPRAVLRSYFERADAFVLPSLAEGFPLGAIEAMLHAVPTIVSTSTFAGDVVEDGTNGFIIPPRDAGSIVDALRMLAEDPDRARTLGLAGRARAQDFTWGRYRATATEAILRAAGRSV